MEAEGLVLLWVCLVSVCRDVGSHSTAHPLKTHGRYAEVFEGKRSTAHAQREKIVDDVKRCRFHCGFDESCSSANAIAVSQSTLLCQMFSAKVRIDELVADATSSYIAFYPPKIVPLNRGFIRHSSGLCIRYNDSSAGIELDPRCDDIYEAVNGTIVRQGTGECIRAATPFLGARLVMSSDCNSPLALLRMSNDGLLEFPVFGSCVHPLYGGDKTNLIDPLSVFGRCVELERLTFHWGH